VLRIVVVADEMQDGDQREAYRLRQIECLAQLWVVEDLPWVAQVGFEEGRSVGQPGGGWAWSSGSLST
jgi:hypothetical protein